MSVRKRIRRHAIDITVILVAVMFVVGIVEVYLDPQLQYVRANNATSLKFTINSASPNLQQFDPSPLIEVATGSLATILAIVFGLSQILVSDATKQYGPRMAEILRTARRYWFAIAVYSIATVTLLSSLALVHAGAITNLVLALSSIGLFAAMIVILIDYLRFFQDVVDPLRYSKLVANQLTSRLDLTSQLKNGALALADAAMKAIIRGGEQASSITFLDSLEVVLTTYLKSSSSSQSTKDDVLETYVDQFKRVYKEATSKNETTVTSAVIRHLHRISTELYGEFRPKT